jgi:ribosomal protein L37AE/L43A
MIRPTLRLVTTRRTLASYQRDLLVQRFAEVECLRADLKRLQRLTTEVARCHQCRVLCTITLQDDGAWRCKRCIAAPKEASA